MTAYRYLCAEFSRRDAADADNTRLAVVSRAQGSQVWTAIRHRRTPDRTCRAPHAHALGRHALEGQARELKPACNPPERRHCRRGRAPKAAHGESIGTGGYSSANLGPKAANACPAARAGRPAAPDSTIAAGRDATPPRCPGAAGAGRLTATANKPPATPPSSAASAYASDRPTARLRGRAASDGRL